MTLWGLSTAKCGHCFRISVHDYALQEIKGNLSGLQVFFIRPERRRSVIDRLGSEIEQAN